MFSRRSMPCAQCGAVVRAGTTEQHRCDPERRVDFQMVAMASSVASFESDLHAYLASNAGRLESWLAFRDVRRRV